MTLCWGKLFSALAQQAKVTPFALGIVGEAFEVGRRALRPEMAHGVLDLGVADERLDWG